MLLILSFPPKINAEDLPALPSGEVVLEIKTSEDLVESKHVVDSSVMVTESYNSSIIKNNISAYASTGQNSIASSTDGDALIKTGDSVVNIEVLNYASSNSNFINTDTDSIINVQANSSNVSNTISAVSETGSNTVIGSNLAQVKINSGASKTSIAILNSLNTSVFARSCDPELKEDKTTPSTPVTTPTPVISQTKVGSYTSNPENVQSGRGGYVLPFTGGKFSGRTNQEAGGLTIYAYLISFVSGYWLASIFSIRIFKQSK